MRTDCDVIIAGNGVLALSTALGLAKEGPELKVAVAGPAARPGSASLAAGAMLASFAEIEKGALDGIYSKAKFEMSRAAAQLWPEWIESVNATAGKKLVALNLGTYLIHNAKADELDDENYAAVLDALSRYQEPHAEIDPAAVPGLAPAHPGTG